MFLRDIYRVILSVVDPRKWGYLKDYSLHFIWLHALLHEKHVDTSLPLSDRLSEENQFPVVKGTWDIGKGGGKILTSSGQWLASGAMSRTAVSLCCEVVKENVVHTHQRSVYSSFVITGWEVPLNSVRPHFLGNMAVGSHQQSRRLQIWWRS